MAHAAIPLVRALAKFADKTGKTNWKPYRFSGCQCRGAMPTCKTFFRARAIAMLITMLVGEVLHFWALTFTTAYSVLAFFGYLGLVYASPSVDQKIRAPESAIDEDARMKRISSSRSSPAARRHSFMIRRSTGQPDVINTYRLWFRHELFRGLLGEQRTIFARCELFRF